MASENNKERNYRLSLVNASTHERLWTLRMSRPVFLLATVSSVVAVILLVFCLIAFTPLRTFVPGYPDAQSRRQAVQNAMRIDSLETRILQWELYTENLRRVVAGEEPIRLDSLILNNKADRATVDSVYLAFRDSLLRADVSAQEQFQLSGTQRKLPIEAVSFYTPVKGVVSRGFALSVHPYLDVTAPAGTVVMSVLDGTVVSTSWEEEGGYSMTIQHDGDILSIYRRNQKLLRKTGDKVKAGTPVAMVGASGSLTAGDHLRFELWYHGDAVDPVQYINF